MSPPSIKEATHHWEDTEFYKVGEETVYHWNRSKQGWERFSDDPVAFKYSATYPVKPIERSYWEVLEAMQEQYGYHPTTPQSTSDCEPVQSVLGVLKDDPPGRKTIDDLYDRTFFSKGLSEERIEELKSTYGTGDTGSVGSSMPLTPSMTEKNDNPRSTTCANNRQVGGDHYKKMKVQPWEIYDSIFNKDEQVGFYLGNVLKYLFRYKNKNGIQDLEKAKHYLEKLIETVRAHV